MPVARILTLHPEDATTLIQQLEQFGFAVEVASPNQEQLAPADLEIEFAVCDQQQVVARAAAIAAQLPAEVVVFPGAMPPVPRPVPAAREFMASLSRPEDAREASGLQQSQPTAETEQSGTGFAALVGVWFTNMGEKLRQAGRRTASTTGAVTTGASSLLNAMASWAVEYRERRRLRAAEVRAAREQRQAEAERRRAEMAHQAALREAEQRKQAEIAAAARQEELQRQQAEREKRLAEMERLRAEAQEHVAALEQARRAAEAQQPSLPAQAPVKPKPVQPLRRPSQVRGIFTGAAAASILFIVGMVLANFSPTNPLPASISNGSVEQQVPFGSATVHPSPLSTKPGNIMRKPVPSRVHSKPANSNAPAAKQKPQPRHFRHSSYRNDEGDMTADDLVVRHYTSPQRPRAQNVQQQAGLKRYSDE